VIGGTVPVYAIAHSSEFRVPHVDPVRATSEAIEPTGADAVFT